MELTFYTVNEWIALLSAVVIGSGAYATFVARKKKEEVNLLFVVSIFLMNLLITWIIVEFLRLSDWGKYRGIGSLLASFFGQYFFDWVDKRYLKIGDSALKRATGLDLENVSNEKEEEDGNEE